MIDGDVLLRGDSTGARIGNVGDRIKVDSQSNQPTIPSTPTTYVSEHFNEDIAGTPDMARDGSVTPLVYTLAPASGKIFYVDHIQFYLQDSGNADADDFGALAGLTNGVILEQKVNGGAVKEVTTLFDNMDIVNHILVDIQNTGSTTGFFNAKFMSGGMQFRKEIILDGTQGDYLRWRVRDDLTGLIFFRCGYRYWEAA